jgi:hypothetical protein
MLGRKERTKRLIPDDHVLGDVFGVRLRMAGI